MPSDAPGFAGRDAPPAFAVAAAALFGLATLAANLAARTGPGAVEAFLAKGGTRAALSVAASSALPFAAALAVAFAAAAAKGAPVRATLRLMPRGRGRPGAAAACFALGALVAAPALATLSVPLARALEALGVPVRPQFPAMLLADPRAWPLPALAMVFSAVVVSPAAEETLYRAVLWQGLCALSGRRAERTLAAACAAFFAAAHGSAFAFAPLALLALALSAVYRRLSLGCTIALHAGFNAGGALMMLLA